MSQEGVNGEVEENATKGATLPDAGLNADVSDVPHVVRTVVTHPVYMSALSSVNSSPVPPLRSAVVRAACGIEPKAFSISNHATQRSDLVRRARSR